VRETSKPSRTAHRVGAWALERDRLALVDEVGLDRVDRGRGAGGPSGRHFEDDLRPSVLASVEVRATLKAEHVDHENFPSREVAHASIGDYIEAFYNTARRHSSIGYVSPLEFELRSHVAALAA
jgi:transposase InsO family protein